MNENGKFQKGGLTVGELTHHYGSKCALDNVSFKITAGTFCALLGPNGAGKSTLFALLTRLLLPAAGKVTIAGIDLSQNPRTALSKMGVVFQQPTLDLDLTVRQNLYYYAALHGISRPKARSLAERALKRLGMAERVDEKVRTLNGGHRRRTEIARALLHGPELLLLDEPTVGLDPEARRSITRHVHQLAAGDGLTVLWATHLVDEVDDADQLVLLHRGQVAANGICAEVRGSDPLSDFFHRLTGSETQ